jgi:putative ABC transport system permease protein
MMNKVRWLGFIPEQLREEIEGDLLQRFNKDVDKHGITRAKGRLLLNTLRFFRPSILLRNKLIIKRSFMIRNYLKIASRNILKQRSYSILNIAGLSLGMAASLLIFQYVKYEQSFDTFHSRAEDIYRIQYNGYSGNALNFESAVTVPAVNTFIKKNFPEVEESTRLLPHNAVVSYESPTRGLISFQETKMQFVMPDFLKVFSFKLIKGDRETCLDGPHKLLISQRAAKKYFADEDPMGKQMNVTTDLKYEVAGVFEDVPENSHIRFDFLMSYAADGSEQSWGWYDFYSFVRVRPGTDIKALQAKIDQAIEKERGESWKEYGNRQDFILRPLLDIHLNSHLLYEAEPDSQRDGDAIYALSIIALFILAIAWINYINLATARSLNRANEVGVRKVMGAHRGQLVGQFITESFIMNLVAVILALILVRVSWNSFSQLSGWHIPLNFIYQADFWMTAGWVFTAGTILSGFYPAIVLSSFRPVAVLKGKLIKSSTGNILRKSLVIVQFAASIFLIVGSIVVYNQLQFMKHQDLGVALDQTMIFKGPGVTDSLFASKYESFKNEVARIPGVKSITASTMIPGDEIYWTNGIRLLSQTTEQRVTVARGRIDTDYIPSYGIKILAGRNFDRQFNDDKRLIVNEALSKTLSFKESKDALGKMVNFGGDTLEIVGVIEDYHQLSLKSTVAPLGLVLGNSSRFFSVKVETENYHSVVDAVAEPWNTFFAGNPVDYFFLDEFFNHQYEEDDRFGEVFTLFTVLAILIASLGLFGLASFMALQRTKEIGIRKVLGSSVSEIMLLLAKGFLQPVLIANVIAWPLAWWVMDGWLQDFPYRITVNPIYLVVAGVIVTLIAFISVSSQTLKAAMTKPADTLKYE